MEHRINKVDVELIQKVLDFTKEEVVHEMKNSQESKSEFGSKRDSGDAVLRGGSKEIIVEAYKVKDEILVDATKNKSCCSGKYIDKKR